MTSVVVGHFNEASAGLLSLIRAMAKATSKCRHRQLRYKSALGGVRPAQARLMRRLGIAAARANAHHLIVARHAIGRVSSGAAQDRARTGAARAGAETSDEDYHRTGSRFEPEGVSGRGRRRARTTGARLRASTLPSTSLHARRKRRCR